MIIVSAIPVNSAGVLTIVHDDDLRLQSANDLASGTGMAEMNKP